MTAQVLQHPATLKRAYESAGMVSALSGWITAAIPPDVDIHAGLRQLRARSREAAQNDDHMKYFLALVESNVVGLAGINVQARPKLRSGKVDRVIAARLETEWAKQSKRGTWDATGQLSRLSCSQLGIRTVAQDGEVLIRLMEGDALSPTGFSVELIDPEALDLDYNALLPNGNVVRMGVEMTPRRRPVAYWLFAESPNPYGGYASTYATTQRTRVPAHDIIHAYLPQWVWGSRGVPWAATALRRMRMLGGYEEAAITAARMAAAKSAAYTASPDADPQATMHGQRQADGSFSQSVEPGQIEQVPYGWNLTALDWQWPNTEHGAFCKAALRGIACGLGVSYNALANDLEGVNFSSLRSGALTERDLWLKLQGWWIEWVEQPIYERWANYAIRSGRVSRPNRQPGREEDLVEAVYQGRRWSWVDPLKDMQANKAQVQLRTKSVSAIIREAGGDPEEVWAELAADIAQLKKLGIPLDFSDTGAAPAPTSAAATPDADDAAEPGASALSQDEDPSDA